MNNNSQFAVAIHVLSVIGALQEHGEERVSSRQIALSVNTNPVVIRNLIALLKKADLVESKEGKGGGLRLVKPSAKISLQEIYRAVIMGSGFLGLSHRPVFQPCPISRGINQVLPTVFGEVDRAIEKSLKGKTLKSMIDQSLRVKK